MNPSRQIGAWMLLVACGVLGRWLQPDWNFTPTAALAVFAGYYFGAFWRAALVPIAVITLSNLLLPAYLDGGVMASVYLSMLLPVGLGRVLAIRPGGLPFAMCCLLPAVAFYLTTNFAVWYFHDWYAATPAGLWECYVQALPFFRGTLAGDVLYTLAVFGAYAVLGERGTTVPRVRRESASALMG